MPDGSSSDDPVTKPGPKTRQADAARVRSDMPGMMTQLNDRLEVAERCISQRLPASTHGCIESATTISTSTGDPTGRGGAQHSSRRRKPPTTTAPPLMAMIILVGNNRAIMGRHVNNWFANLMGWAIVVIMGVCALALIGSLIAGA